MFATCDPYEKFDIGETNGNSVCCMRDCLRFGRRDVRVVGGVEVNMIVGFDSSSPRGPVVSAGTVARGQDPGRAALSYGGDGAADIAGTEGGRDTMERVFVLCSEVAM